MTVPTAIQFTPLPLRRSSRIGSAFARPDSAQRLFPPPESFRCNIVSVRLAPVFPLVPTEFLRRGPRRRVQLPIPLTSTREALIRCRSWSKNGYINYPDLLNKIDEMRDCPEAEAYFA